MRRRIKKTLAAALAANLLFLCGCGVKGTELGKRLIVEAIGVDRTPEGVLITLEALDAHAADESSGSEQNNTTKILRFSGATAAQALARIAPSTGLSPLLSQARVLVLGRTLAEAGLADALDVFLREYNVRGDILIAVAEDTAAAVVAATPDAAVPGAAVLEDVLTAGMRDGTCAAAALYEFINLSLSETDAAYCPVIGLREGPAEGKETPQPLGAAFFEGDRLAFTADGRLTQGMLFLKNIIKSACFSVRGAEGTYTLRAVSSRTKISPEKTAEGRVSFKIAIRAVCDIAERTRFSPEMDGGDAAADARAAGEAYLKALASDCLDTLFYKNRADLCRFARRVRLKYPGLAAAYEETMFTDTKITVSAELTVRRTGKEGG
jgi:spore germination protein KC